MKENTQRKTTMIFFAVIVVFCFIGFLWHRYFWFDLQYDKQISVYCTQYNVSKELVYAVVKAESNFKADAVSNKGATGLMQLMPATAEFVAKKIDKNSFDLKKADDNLQIGIYYLSYLQQKFDTQKQVVMAYNAGENTVKRWIENGEKGVYKETSDYEKRVEKNLRIFNSLYK